MRSNIVRQLRRAAIRAALVGLLPGLVVLPDPVQAVPTGGSGPVLLSRTERQVEIGLPGARGLEDFAGSGSSVRYRWHVEDGVSTDITPWVAVTSPVPSFLRIARPTGAALLEIVVETEAEDGHVRRVFPIPMTHDAQPEPRVLDGMPTRLARAPEDSVTVSGRVVVGDRLFDADGYTGARQWLPVRGIELQWRSSADDQIVAVTATDSAGSFSFALGVQPVAGRLVLRTRGTDPVAGPFAVVNAAGAAHAVELGLVDPAPGQVLDLGTVEVLDTGASSLAGAVHLFDLLTDALGLLREPSGPSEWAVAGQGVDVRWDPAVPNATTFFDGTLVIVASPAAGSSDAWSDGAVLAAIGHALLRPLGWPQPSSWDWVDADRAPQPSLARALGWTFAGAVQAWRDQSRVDAGGARLQTPVELVVDLPSPPPLGFVVGLEAGIDLETAVMLPGQVPVVARGQRGAAVLSTLLWESLDDDATYLSLPRTDDDPVEADLGRWFAAMATALQQSTSPVYEDLHDQLVASMAELSSLAFTGLATAQAGCALEIDAFEPDGTAVEASPLPAWTQPALATSGVRVNEIYLGDRDGVELVNRGPVTVDVGGWTIDARRNGFTIDPTRTVILASPTLILPGRALLVLEGTSLAARSVIDASAPNGNVPWAPDEDGAVILRDAQGAAVDFVRWDGDGGADRSLEPIPAGTGFSGRLVAPVDGRQSLARDAISTDTNSALNFSIATSTPGWPNVEPARVHTLRPRGDVDHVLLEGTGPFEVHARRDRDDGNPRWSFAEGGTDAVALLQGGIGGQGRGALATLWPTGVDTSNVLRLDTTVAASTSTGLRVFAWRPASDFGVWPVRGLRADPLGLDLQADSVRVTWSLRGTTDSLRVRLDGVAVRHLGGTDTTAVILVPKGTHTVSVEPFLADRVGASRSVGVFVGPVPCAVATGFEPGDPVVLGTETGFSVTEGVASSAVFALRDAAPGLDYPVSSVATTTLLLPIELTATARLRFAHAVHLVPDGDHAVVEISTDEGMSWEELARWDGAAHPIGAEDPADWGDSLLTLADFVQEDLGLGAYAGERVRIRWKRTSNGAGTSIGWSIDDVVVDLGGAAGEYWVGVDGSDVTGCGIPGRPWASLVPALAAARPGDRIVLGPGRHHRAATAPSAPVPVFASLPAGVELRGAGPEATTLVTPSGGWGLWTVGSDPDSSAVTVRALRIEGGTVGMRMVDVAVQLDSVEIVLADTAAVLLRAPTIATASVVAHAAVGLRTEGGWLDLRRSTLADVGIGVWLGAEGDSLRAFASLLGRADSTLVFTDAPSAAASIECSGIFGTLVPYVGPVSVTTLANRNFDPQHCDPTGLRYSLAASSPYLAQPWCGLVGARGQGCAVPGVTDAPVVVADVRLLPPAPNPFNPVVTLAWEQPRSGHARLEVFDLRGRRVRVLADEMTPAGRRLVQWRGEDARGASVASGVYLVRLSIEGEHHVQRVALIR